jgi:hypothetical protein
MTDRTMRILSFGLVPLEMSVNGRKSKKKLLPDGHCKRIATNMQSRIFSCLSEKNRLPMRENYRGTVE